MIELRPYQNTAVNEIREALSKYRRVLFQAQTAFGKTITFSYIAFCSQKYNRKVLILSDRTEILKQNGGALERLGIDIDYISPRFRNIPSKNISCGMAQTIQRRVGKSEWREYLASLSLVIIDECHLSSSDYIHPYLSDNCFVLGCTATPRRYGNKVQQLGELYKAMVKGITTRELVELGYIAKPRMYSVVAPKLDIPIDQSTGDYNRKALAERYESKVLYKGVVSEWMRLTPNTKTICFCCSSAQTIAVCREFNDNGISAKYLLSGEFEEDNEFSGEREQVIEDFKQGKFQVLVNLNIATSGLDVPDIQTVILNFATISLPRYRQAMGRACRIAPNKTEFNVLDCGENIRRHGGFLDEQNWCLWHSTTTGSGMQMLKTCDPLKPDRNGKYGCNQLIPNTCRECPNCGKIQVDEKWDYVLHLEEVKENTEENSIESYVAERRLEGWSIPRILINICASNPDEMKKAFTQGYLALSPTKTPADAHRYYYVFMKQFGDNIKIKKTC